MKAELLNEKQKFNPVSIVLTFEAQDELDAFRHLFNWNPICDYLKSHDIESNIIRDKLDPFLVKDNCGKFFEELRERTNGRL